MKKFDFKKTNWAIAMSLLALGTAVSTSCSKQDKQELIAEQGAKIIVKVTGVADEQGSLSTKGSTSTAANKPKVTNYSEYDAMMVVDEQLPASPMTLASGGRSLNIASNIGTKAGTVAPDVKYTLFLFNPDGSIASTNPLTTGTSGTINVTPGITYTWAALSYNNGEDVGAPAAGTTKIALNGGKDVLYASGSITVPTNGGNAPININFNRKFSRLGVEINTMGMFADMENATVNVTGQSVQTATINLTDGKLTDFVDFPQTINYASFTNTNPTYGDSKIAYIYTANDAKSDIKVAVSNLKIKLDDESSRSFSTTANFTFSNINPVMGKSYRLLTNLIESPVQIKSNGAQWARHNLYYVGNSHNPYRFHHTNKPSTDRGTFFSFRALTSNNFGINSDACAQVYPAGVWKVASSNNYGEISGDYTPILGYLNQLAPSTKGSNFYEYAGLNSNVGAPYESKNLRFYMNGGGTSLGLVNGILGLSLGNNGSRIEQWTETAGLDLLGLASLGAVSFEGYNGALTGNPNSVRSTNILNVSALGIDVLETRFKNVRCVRAN